MRIVGFDEHGRVRLVANDGTRMTADLVIETSDDLLTKQQPYIFHLGGYLTLHNPRRDASAPS